MVGVWPIFVASVVYIFSLPFIWASFLIFGVPGIYLSWRKPKLIKKSLLFTILIVGTVSWALDHMAFLDRTWFVDGSILRILGGTIPIEDIFFGFCWSYFGIIFWEYFLDLDREKIKFNPLVKYLVVLLGIGTTIFFALYFLKSNLLYQPYFYLKFGLVMLVPVILVVLIKFPRLFKKILVIGLYFFIISIIGEYVGLARGHWYFPGNNYIGTTQLGGNLVPWDEIIFWCILGMPGLICWYEIFADDKK